MPGLPKGYKLDQPTSSLPQGYTLDVPTQDVTATDATVETPATPRSLYQRARDKFMDMTAPKDASTYNESDVMKEMGKGAVRGAAMMVRHPVDSVVGGLRFGRDYAAALLTTDKGIRAHPGDPSNNYGVLPRAVGDEILREKDELHDTLHQGKEDFLRNPGYFIGEQVGQALVTEGAARGVRFLRGKAGGAPPPGGDSGLRTAEAKVETKPGILKRTVREKFNAGRDFAQEKVQKFGEQSQKVRDENAAKEAAHKKAVEKQEAAAKFAKDTERVRRETAEQHAAESEKQAKAYDTAEAEAKKENDAAWDKWRKKVKTAKAQMQSVVDVVNAQARTLGRPEDVSQFRQILRDTRPTEDGDLTDVALLRNQVAEGQGFGKNYSKLTPERQKVVNDLVDRMGLDSSEDGGEGLKDIPASLLHGYKTALEAAVRRTEGTVKYAIGEVLKAVRAKEEEVSEAAGATKELKAARELHGPFVDAFRNSPNEPQTVKTTTLRKQTPKFTEEKAQLEREKMMAQYDRLLPEDLRGTAERAERIRSLEQTLNNLPKPKETAAAAAKPVPEPKESKPLPEAPDLTAERRATLDKGLKKYGDAGQWVWRLVLGSTIEAGAKLLGGSLTQAEGTFASGLLLGQAGLKILSNALRQPSVLDWLSKPTAEDLADIDTLPPADAERMRAALTHLAEEDVKRGGTARSISPKVAAFLGSENMQAITNAAAKSGAVVPANAGEAKRRAEAAKAAVAAP